MRIGFDLDDVICDLISGLLRRLTAAGAISSRVTSEDIKWWDLAYDAETREGLPGVTTEHLFSVFNDHSFWPSLSPYQDALEMLGRLRHENEIYIVTDRRWYRKLEDQTAKWLHRHAVPCDRLIICESSRKWEPCQEHRINFFVDDKPENIEVVADVVQGAYLLDRPWNRSAQTLPRNAVRGTLAQIGQDLENYAVLYRKAEEFMKIAEETDFHLTGVLP